MNLEILLLFIPACFALNLTPGPNNLLAMNNAQRFSLTSALLAGIGRLVAFAVMIALAAGGLAMVLYTSEFVFTAIKVIGALYLFHTAWKLWFVGTGKQEDVKPESTPGLKSLMKQEFLLAAGNPKAILIFTAFLPQFVDPAGNVPLQFAIVGGLFLLMEWVAIGLYGAAGVYLRQWFARPAGQRLFNRICSVLLAGAGGGLLVSQR